MAEAEEVQDPTRELPIREGSERQTNQAAGHCDAVLDPAAGSGQARTVPAAVTAGRNRGFRGLLWAGGIVAVLVALLVGARAINILPGFDSPFSDRTTDRSQPVLLQSMRDLSRYVAADGSFQVIVDLQEDKENIPQLLINKRTLFVGAGTVQAYVDFSTLSDGAIRPNADNTAVTITLPAPQLGEAALDLRKSYVVAEQRGLLNRISDAFSDDPGPRQQVYQLAQQRITEAAAASELTSRAQENTQKMLEGLLRTLGYTTVTVSFSAP